jgi:hypothetical protein
MAPIVMKATRDVLFVGNIDTGLKNFVKKLELLSFSLSS